MSTLIELGMTGFRAFSKAVRCWAGRRSIRTNEGSRLLKSVTVADRLVLSHAPRPNRERTHRRLLAAISKAQPNAGPPLRKGLPVGKLGGEVLADALDSKVEPSLPPFLS